MHQRSLQSLFNFLLTCSVLQVCQCERTFISVNSSEIACNSGNLIKCSSDLDCLLVEVHNDTTSLSAEEWGRMSQTLQQLATEDRLDDAYPDDMWIRAPLSGLSHRVCPVNYTPEVDENRVPMLIVNARCQNAKCQGGNNDCNCTEVLQYRQVYRLLKGCRFIGPSLPEAVQTHRVFVKAFDHVSVNCAAMEN